MANRFNPGEDGGFIVHPGLYRVPDLLTEDDFVRYMKSTYGVDVMFIWPNEPSPEEPSQEEIPVYIPKQKKAS